MTGDEHEDPRYSDGHDREDHDPDAYPYAGLDRCPGGGPDDDSAPPSAAGPATFGPGYVQDLMAVQDAQVPGHALDLLAPGLCHRWPEPRVLWQDAVWWARDRVELDLDYAAADDARWLLGELHGALTLHGAAARDEELTTSTGLRRALDAAGIPMIGDHDPAVWLESTVLVRALRRIAAGPDRAGTHLAPWPR